jgi:hypothetical protein
MRVSFLGNQALINGQYIQQGQTVVDILNYNFESIIEKSQKLHDDCREALYEEIDECRSSFLLAEIDGLIKKINEELKTAPFYKYDQDLIFADTLLETTNNFIDLAPIDTKHTDFDEDELQYLEDEIKGSLKYKREFSNLAETYREFVELWNAEDFPNARGMNSELRSFTNASNDYMAIDIMYDMVPDAYHVNIAEVYNIKTLGMYAYIDLFKTLKPENTIIRKCKNCGKYFLVNSGRNIEYCDNIPEGETRPCSEIGSLRAYAEKVKGDPLLTLYNRAYKTHYARRKKTTGEKRMTPNEFATWCDDAKLKLEKAQAGEITMSDFASWLKI